MGVGCLCGCWELNSGLMQEQDVLSTSELSLPLHLHFLYMGRSQLIYLVTPFSHYSSDRPPDHVQLLAIIDKIIMDIKKTP